jgi:hypothetical protein
MDINFHYFAVKTLACHAGFEEAEAQTIAWYSQQVDNFTMHLPLYVTNEPPAYFMQNHYARKLNSSLWLVLPHPTGIDMTQTLGDYYRHTTLAPFHFIPGQPFAELRKKTDATRADYRCVPGNSDEAQLIHQIVEQAVDAAKKDRSEESLMQLGMALHTYADTYAHCGFSGLEGWENKAVIEKVFNQHTQKEEIPKEERLFFRELPHIGHGNAGTAPDICAAQIDLAMQNAEDDKALSLHINRDNRIWFLQCAREILDILCDVLGVARWNEDAWQPLSEKIAAAMQVPGAEETKKDFLISQWSSYFPNISYHYEKNERFFEKEDTVSQEVNGFISHPTHTFYEYNEIAYRRAELVLGEATLLQEKKEQLARHADTLADSSFVTTAQLKSDREDNWKPKTDLAVAVYTAGFEYFPDKDIIGSTQNNVQRMGGYCWAYDEAAPAISSVIDCEPIYFRYGDYEWMLELWKGQYGIETGCEAGIYYREWGKPMSPEEKITGKIYQCVDDEHMLDMTFSLQKNGEELFAREWTKHWWLTGFRWGVLSNPEELQMIFAVRFPTHEMQQAFLYGGENLPDKGENVPVYGLAARGYEFTEPDETTVQFCFAAPFTKQPAIREKMRNMLQTVNGDLVNEYDQIRSKYHIDCNDPNVISDKLIENAGIAEKELYEKLIRHYYKNRKCVKND